MSFYFAPDQDCLTPLLEAINSAKQSILVADYSFNLPSLVDSLIAQHQKGVKVTLVLDRSQSFGKSEVVQIQRLRQAGIDFVIGTSDKHKIMHLKCAVVDNQTVINGSYNFTTAAASESNVLEIFTDPEIAELFTAQIKKIYQFISENEPQGLSLILERTSMDYKAIVIRAVKTFGQAIVAFVVANLASILSTHSLSTGKQLAFAALVAGVSAVWNLVLVPLFRPVTEKLGLRS